MNSTTKINAPEPRDIPTTPPPIIPPVESQADKIAALLQLQFPIVIEIASVGWYGTQYWAHYSNGEWHRECPALANYNLTPVQARFEKSKWLAEFERTSDLSDDTLDLEFNDFDWNVTSLWWGYGGEGVPVKILQYYPQIDLLLEIFDGYMRTPKESNGFKFTIEVAAGFRSPLVSIPRRVVYTGCQAIFGGLINPTTNAPWFPTQESINLNDCPYSVHLGPPQLSNPNASGFGKLDPATSQPFKTCPRQRPADCTARLGDSKSYLGFDVITGSEVQGRAFNWFIAYIRANETALKQPIRVVYGVQRVQDLTLLAYESGSHGSNDQAKNGFLSTIWIVAEGPNGGVGPATNNLFDPDKDGNPGPSFGDSSIRINEAVIGSDHVNYSGTFGMKRQAKALPQQAGLGAQQLNYSGTSIINLDYGQGDFRNFQPDSLRATCRLTGKKDIRVYTTPTAFTRTWTTNRAWCLLDMLTHKRYGYGLDWARFNLQEWIDLAAWCDQSVPAYGESGEAVSIKRSTFNGVVDSRTAQNVLGDFCMLGRFSPPFQDQGKLRVIPLRDDEVAVGVNPAFSGPTLADFDNDIAPAVQRNIVKDTLSYSIKPDSELANELKFTFNDHNYDDQERPLVLQDLDRQLLVGRAAGDLSLRVVSKSYAGFGINNLSEAARMATMLLYFGEFDSGGVKNNFTIKFTTWGALAKLIGLHPFQVIRVLSQRINRFTERGTLEWQPYAADSYQFFRITSLKRTQQMLLEVEAQLYPRSAMQQFQSVPGAGGTANPSGQKTTPPEPVTGTTPDVGFTKPDIGGLLQIKAS